MDARRDACSSPSSRGEARRPGAPGRHEETVAEPGGSPNGLAIGPDGACYVATAAGGASRTSVGMLIPEAEQPPDYSGGRIERIDLDTGDVTVLYTECDGNELIGPNDLVFDAHGGLWFTDHGKHRGRVQHHRRDLLRAARRLVDPRSRVPARLAERHRPVARRHALVRRRDATPVASTRGREAPGEVERTPAARRQLICGLPGHAAASTRSGSTATATSSSATLVTGALTVISPDGELLDQVDTARPDGHQRLFGRSGSDDGVRDVVGHRSSGVAALAPSGAGAGALSERTRPEIPSPIATIRISTPRVAHGRPRSARPGACGATPACRARTPSRARHR